MADREKKVAASNAILDAIAKRAPNAAPAHLEQLARAFRAVEGGAQPGGGCDCASK